MTSSIRHAITKMSRFHIASTERIQKQDNTTGRKSRDGEKSGVPLGAENASLIKEMDKEELGNIVGRRIKSTLWCCSIQKR